MRRGRILQECVSYAADQGLTLPNLQDFVVFFEHFEDFLEMQTLKIDAIATLQLNGIIFQAPLIRRFDWDDLVDPLQQKVNGGCRAFIDMPDDVRWRESMTLNGEPQSHFDGMCEDGSWARQNRKDSRCGMVWGCEVVPGSGGRWKV